MIQAKNLVFQYDTKQDEGVLNNVNIEVRDGEFVAVLGHNGSGKSTLAKHFNAILLPCGGSVLVDNMDTKDEKLLFEIRQRVGMVFQNPDNQIVATIVEEDVAFAPENLGVPSAEIRQRVDQALEAVGMSDYKRHEPHLLSGGQKQRVAIAGVLAMHPECIVLDEPTAMLDPIGRREVLSTLRRLNKEQGITIVLITHNMDEAAQADRLLVMHRGEVVLQGTPKQVFRNVEKMKQLKLDVPQVTELTHVLRQEGIPLPDDILTIDEAYQALSPLMPQDPPPFSSQTLPRNAEKTILQTQNLCYDYSIGGPFEKRALDNVSLDIRKGEYIGIIGHTGSGKSTLVQQFNGLLKPTSGKILFEGTDITDKAVNLREIRGKIGLVFQYPEYQLFEETVAEDIAFGARNMGLDEQQVKQRVTQAAKAVGVSEELFDKSPFELSGGQKRRVAIAGVLAMQPEVLILDEPTAGLDPHGREEILAQIDKMHKETGITILLVSHGMEDIAKSADRLLVMNHGKVFLSGTPTEVYRDYRKLEDVGLTAPQVTKLLDRLCGVHICTVQEAKDYLLPVLRREKYA